MNHSIENEKFKITVKEHGCELSSIYSKENNTEFLWQGDKSIWYGQSPILFPIVGRLIDDSYTLNGKVYSMPKHGFARNLQWEVVKKSSTSITFALYDSEETRKIYPFSFEFFVTYSISQNKLTAHYEIHNKGTDTMYFSFGAHPAFNCNIGDDLVFEKNETLDAMKIDLEKSLVLPNTYPVLKNENTLKITNDIFKEDALIFKAPKSQFVKLKSKNHLVKFTYNTVPYLGIWAKPGAPYVCIEPWFGLNDLSGCKKDFNLKEGINALNSNETFSYFWCAEFSANR